METILLQSNSKKDIKMLLELARKIGFRARVLTVSDMEDIGLAQAMNEGRTGKYVDNADYLKKLKKK